MDRRDFIRTAAAAGIAAGISSCGEDKKAVAKTSGGYDLVAIKGGGPAEMFDKAIARLGGMKKFVKKNQTVVVKPNIGWDTSPERAANTNPLLVKRIVESCYEAGAKTVYVFDHTCDNWKKCYSNSGIERAAKDAGAKVVAANSEKYYGKVSIPKARKLKSTQVHELIEESDVFINAPILKSHGSTKLTIAMKNLMGVVWDRRWQHRNDLHQCIADFPFYRMPDLNIIDAYRVLKRNGPRGVSEKDAAIYKTQIISTDIVAADAAAAKIFGIEPGKIDYIKIAHGMKQGNMNLDELNIKRIKM